MTSKFRQWIGKCLVRLSYRLLTASAVVAGDLGAGRDFEARGRSYSLTGTPDLVVLSVSKTSGNSETQKRMRIPGRLRGRIFWNDPLPYDEARKALIARIKAHVESGGVIEGQEIGQTPAGRATTIRRIARSGDKSLMAIARSICTKKDREQFRIDASRWLRAKEEEDHGKV